MSVETMRAVMYLEPGKIEMREVPIPSPGPGEILVKVRTALTDGTDLKTYRRGHPNITPPAMFGHEFAGDVQLVGSEVDKFKVGMRVVPHNSAPCFACYYCKRGDHSMCENLFFNRSGAYAEYAVVPGNILKINTFEIPEHISYAQAAVMEPLSCVVHGQAVVQIQPGETVAIVGAGGSIGLMHLQLARQRGSIMLIAVDINPHRLELAKKLGATHVIDASSVDPVKAVKELTSGRGVDVAIESAGAVEAWQTAINSVRKGGRVLWFGGLKPGTMINLDTKWIHYGELTLYGVFHATPIDVQHAFDLIVSGVVDTKALISGERSMEELEEVLQMMIRGDCIKMAIRPDM